jgi:TM2 domain-containing membrane protein YozV
MSFPDPIYTAAMSPEQRSWFYAEFEQGRRDEVVGVLLALFLGSFGIHHFYLRRNGLGVLYILFSWTGIPAILGFIEAFLMPGRVRRYNAEQAAYISSQILAGRGGVTITPTLSGCPACGGAMAPGAAFCPHCGVAMPAKV